MTLIFCNERTLVPFGISTRFLMKDRIPPTVNPPQLLIISDSMRLKGIVVLFSLIVLFSIMAQRQSTSRSSVTPTAVAGSRRWGTR